MYSFFSASRGARTLRRVLCAGSGCCLVLAVGCGESTSVSSPANSQVEIESIEGDSVAVVDGDSTSGRDSAEQASPQLHPSLEGQDYDAVIRDVVAREDPLVDGWDTERFSDLAMRQLKEMGGGVSQLPLVNHGQLRKLCAKDYRGMPLRPALKTALDEPPFLIKRGAELENGPNAKTGSQGLLESLRSLRGPFQRNAKLRYKFKIVKVDLQKEMGFTTVLCEFVGKADAGQAQINTTWECEWAVTDQAVSPRLKSIDVKDYEEILVTTEGSMLFSDCTRSALKGLDALDSQLIHGRDYWYGNLEGSIGVEGRGNGMAIGDANGDGLDDIYLCQPAALPNRLLIRQVDGSLVDESEAAGVDWLDSTRAALWVDIDSDGDEDLLLTQSTEVLLHENDGSGRFELRNRISTDSRLFSFNAIDFDSDGDLDLYVCGYSAAAQTRPTDIFVSPMPYHDANNGGPNFLFENEGDWSFRDVTEETGLDENNLRFSLASVWDDFDNDGDPDLYVANDFGRNNLYRNDDGRFVDIAPVAGVEDIGPGMSAAWGDHNNDGKMDLYVSNMFSSAGSRITRQRQFKPQAETEDLVGFQRHARGNSLFENIGDGQFADRSLDLGITMGRWAWGSLFVDLNNDGWRDLYVTNGFVTADNNNDL
ncbi:MAG: VCBS repeat-containing protein [Planctomycetaceae bacterium]|nr:VCBS repeat-containing protein [Planctomycetaceae bacterium]